MSESFRRRVVKSPATHALLAIRGSMLQDQARRCVKPAPLATFLRWWGQWTTPRVYLVALEHFQAELRPQNA